MTSPPKEIHVVCPRCGHEYKAWIRPSINLTLGEKWTKSQITRATTSVCPECKFRVRHGAIIVGGDGPWNVDG